LRFAWLSQNGEQFAARPNKALQVTFWAAAHFCYRKNGRRIKRTCA